MNTCEKTLSLQNSASKFRFTKLKQLFRPKSYVQISKYAAFVFDFIRCEYDSYHSTHDVNVNVPFDRYCHILFGFVCRFHCTVSTHTHRRTNLLFIKQIKQSNNNNNKKTLYKKKRYKCPLTNRNR